VFGDFPSSWEVAVFPSACGAVLANPTEYPGFFRITDEMRKNYIADLQTGVGYKVRA
jgi:hypothetical protein